MACGCQAKRWLQVRGYPDPVMDFSSFSYCSNILCVVNLKVLGLKASWYTGFAFTRYLQSYNMWPWGSGTPESPPCMPLYNVLHRLRNVTACMHTLHLYFNNK